jgi:hypothetical protein
MSDLTVIRILRDLLCLIAAVGFALATVGTLGAIDAYQHNTDWRVGDESQIVVVVLVIVSVTASIGWFLVQRKESVMARQGLTKRCSERLADSGPYVP